MMTADPEMAVAQVEADCRGTAVVLVAAACRETAVAQVEAVRRETAAPVARAVLRETAAPAAEAVCQAAMVLVVAVVPPAEADPPAAALAEVNPPATRHLPRLRAMCTGMAGGAR